MKAVRSHLKARQAIEDSSSVVFVSAASAWEIATKFRRGKLPGATAIVNDIAGTVASQAFSPLAVSLMHAQRAGDSPASIAIPSTGCWSPRLRPRVWCS